MVKSSGQSLTAGEAGVNGLSPPPAARASDPCPPAQRDRSRRVAPPCLWDYPHALWPLGPFVRAAVENY